MTITIVFAYLILVLTIGVLGHKFFRGTGEDYFIASRSIGSFVLLMSLFSTHMTAFSILGASGQAYHQGVGVFGLMASSSALVVPIIFFFVGTRLWSIGKKYGYLTQVQYFRERWDSDSLGLLIFIILVLLIIPYLLIGVMGGGDTLSKITDNQIPKWLGSLLICVVVVIYVCYGGMRSTAWANTFQALVFMVLGGATFVLITRKMGGVSSIAEKINTDLLVPAHRLNPIQFISYTCIPLSTAMFPHMFMHWLTAKHIDTFRFPIIFYPVCIAIVWIPSVILGVFGTVAVPGLQGAEANSVLIQMIKHYSPDFLVGLLAAGIFAAIMSSLDSQSLSIGNMFTHDIVIHYRFYDQISEKKRVLIGRLFVFIVLSVTYILSLVSTPSIFKLGIWSFTGFASLFPIVIAAVFWKRSNKFGAFSSALSVIVLWTYFFLRGWQVPDYTVANTGIMPVVFILAVSTIAIVGGSLITRSPDPDLINKFFPPDTRDLNSIET